MKFNYYYSPIEQLLKQKLKFGRYYLVEMSDRDGYELRITWLHGINQYVIAHRFTRQELINHESKSSFVDYFVSILNEIISIRDSMIRNVIFWTNCKDVR